jgi:putative two-component system response regulator
MNLTFDLDRAVAESRILVVDDDDSNVLLLERTLGRAGYANVRSLRDSRKVLASVVDYQPDLILLDIMMPHLDGFEVMEQLRPLIPDDEFLPVLILTADGTTETRHRGLACGAKDFLTKPLDLVEVLQRVRNLLESRAMHEHLRNERETLNGVVRERTRTVVKAREETLVLLARSAEYRDDDTGEHTQRVGANAATLACSLGEGSEKAELLGLAAPLHDLGKLGIPDSILLKPGRLSPEEFGRMKAHTTIGASIMAGSDWAVLQMGERIALSHHERWDGTGYPNGIAGREIPLEARITTVVDVFDALTHSRPYKEAWPVAKAVAELERCAGTFFDPEVVAAFVARLASGDVRL